MYIFRKDRLIQNDNERFDALTELLKKSRKDEAEPNSPVKNQKGMNKNIQFNIPGKDGNT